MKMFWTNDRMIHAERFASDVLSLPIHPFLKKTEVEYICDCIGDFYGF